MPLAGSNIIFEVQEPIQKVDDDYKVLFSYNGEYLDFCKNGKKEDKFACQFKDLKRIVAKDFTTENFQ